MNNLLILILDSFLKNFTNMKHIATNSLKIKNLINFIDFRDEETVAIIGFNCWTWVYIYIGCLFTNRKLVILHDTMLKEEIVFNLFHNRSLILFMDNHIYKSKILNEYDIYSQYIFIFDKNGNIELKEGLNALSKEDSIKTILNAKLKNTHIASDIVDCISDTSIYNQDVAIIQYSSGTTALAHPTAITYEQLYENIKFIKDNIKLSKETTVYNELSVYSTMYILTSTICNSRLLFNHYLPSEENVVIISKKTFQDKLLSLKISLFKNILFRMLWNIPLLNLISKYGLKRALNRVFGSDVKEYILLDGYNHPLVSDLIKNTNLPVSTCYSLSEIGGIANYKKLKQKTKWFYQPVLENDNQISLVDYIQKNIYTDDIGKIINNEIVVLGKKEDMILEEIHSSAIEEIIKFIPGFKDCKLVRLTNNKIVLILVPNWDNIDTDHIVFRYTLDYFSKRINSILKKEQIYRIDIHPNALLKNAKGENVLHIYRHLS